MTVTSFSELRECSLLSSVSTRHLQALLVSRKRESQVGQVPIVPGGVSLPFPWNIIFAICIVKNGYYCKFCSRNIFYSIQVATL